MSVRDHGKSLYLLHCSLPNPTVLVGDDTDDRSVVISIYDLLGEESLCVQLTQNLSYPTVRQITLQINKI